MTDFPWLTCLVLVPLVGAVVTALVPSKALAKQVGLGFALLGLVGAVAVAAQFETDGGWQFTETHRWIDLFGVHYALGLDGMGLVMVLLTAVLVPIVLLASWTESEEGNPKAFFAWTLALQAASVAVFTATDVFLFYVVFEATLIPAYFLVAGFGGEKRGRAATKFLLYQLAGGLVMLLSVVGLYVVSAQAGSPSYLLTDLAQLELDPTTERWLFVGFMVAFLVKAPLFPVHTWLADTTEQATPATSVLLVCVLDKIGTFGMLRFCLGLFPGASDWATPVVIALALVSIVYGAFIAIGSDDLLRLVGLTSLSHFGLIVLGIFTLSSTGGAGAVLYMVNHGVGTALLFLVAGHLIRRTGTASISQMRGMEKSVPVLAGLFLLAGLAACGLPGLSPFVSELMVIVAAFGYAWWVGAIAVTAIVLAAIYALWAYQRAFTGPPPQTTAPAEPVRDLSGREVGILAPLVLALVLFGFYPAPLLDAINPTVDATLQHAGVGDHAPEVTTEQEPAEGAHP